MSTSETTSPSNLAARIPAPRHIGGKTFTIVVAVVAIILAFLPMVVGSTLTFVLGTALLQLMLSLVLYLVMGLAGHFSLGQIATVGVGAYVGVGLMGYLGLDGVIGIPLTALAGAVLGGLIGVACLRVDHLYIAFVTIAIGLILSSIASNASFTGGAAGVFNYQTKIFGQSLLDPSVSYWVALFFTVLACAVIWSLQRGGAGRALVALREVKPAAVSAGVNSSFYMIAVFAITGAFCAVGGAIESTVTPVLSPDVFDLDFAVQILVVVIIGGLRSWPGVIVASILVSYVRFGLQGTFLKDYVLIIYSVIVVLVILVLPRGLGTIENLIERRRERAFRAK